jgi:hypothetical protein
MTKPPVLLDDQLLCGTTMEMRWHANSPRDEGVTQKAISRPCQLESATLGTRRKRVSRHLANELSDILGL